MKNNKPVYNMLHRPVPRELIIPLAARIYRRAKENSDGCLLLNARAVEYTGRRYNPRVIVWLYEHGELPPRRYVLPKCGNKHCIRASHLALSDENCNFLPGRSYQHQANNRYTVLTDAQVRRLRAEPPERTNTELAREYGISAVRIADARRGESYRWVK